MISVHAPSTKHNPTIICDIHKVYTVEPPNKGHLGTRASVVYSEVSFIRRLEMH